MQWSRSIEKIGNNQRENKQFSDATKWLSKDSKDHIHRIISKRKKSYKDIKELSERYL